MSETQARITERVTRLANWALSPETFAYPYVDDVTGVIAALSHETKRADLLQAAVHERIAERDEALTLNEHLRRQAEQWAQEARTHESSLHEAYQIVTGGKGEPGNWNGAEPIRKAFDALAERVRVLEGENRGLLGALSWLDAPFIDANTKEPELRSRIAFVLADRDRVRLSPSPLVEGGR